MQRNATQLHREGERAGRPGMGRAAPRTQDLAPSNDAGFVTS
jgi:hypothetical protein